MMSAGGIMYAGNERCKDAAQIALRPVRFLTSSLR